MTGFEPAGDFSTRFQSETATITGLHLDKLVGVVGFEPTKASAVGFTDPALCPLAYTPKIGRGDKS